MPIVADAAAAVRADLNPFIKDLKGADKHVQSLGDRIKNSLSPKNIAVGLAGGFAASQVLNFLTDATQAAGVFQDTVSATGVLFDEQYTPALEKWADTAHSAFGASKQDALDAANSMAVFGKAAGLSGQELVDFATDLTQLGGDLASFFGGRTEDAITAVGSALRGEFEPIRRYGVLLDDATLRQKAFEMGLISSVSEGLTPQIKTLAAQAAIMEQTADAQGDFARTSDGLMNTQRDLAAEFENLQIEIGEQLLPVFTELAKFARDNVIPALRSIVPIVVNLAKVAVPLLAAGLAIKLVAAFKAAQVAGVTSALAVKTAWAAALLLIPAIVDENKRAAASAAEATIAERDGAEAAKVFADALAATGGDASAAMKALEDYRASVEAGTGNADVAASHYMAMGKAMQDASGTVEDGAREMASVVETEWEKAHKEAVADARALPGDLAQALIDGQSDVESGMTALTDLMEESLSDAAKMARLRGQRTTIELSGGLTDERADVRASAQQLYQDVKDQLELLASGAADAAVDMGTTLDEQLRLQSVKAGTAAAHVAQAAMAEMKFNAYAGGTSSAQTFIDGIKATIGSRKSIQDIHLALNELRNRSLGGSLPKEGPFAHPETGAISIAERWLDFLGMSLKRGMLALQNPMTGLGSWATPLLAPATPSTGTATGLATNTASVINNTWALNVNGVPYSFNTRDDFIKALDDLSAFSDGRASG